MRTADTILGLLTERGKKGLPLERLYKLLFNRNLFLEAYGKMYRNQGAMTEESPTKHPTACPWQRWMPSWKLCDMSGNTGCQRDERIFPRKTGRNAR